VYEYRQEHGARGLSLVSVHTGLISKGCTSHDTCSVVELLTFMFSEPGHNQSRRRQQRRPAVRRHAVQRAPAKSMTIVTT
jgi:hypothetical protein